MLSGVTKEEKEFMGNLYDKYYPFWYKTAFEIVNDEQITKDMVNEAFLKLINKSNVLKTLDKNALLTYVVITITNTCKTYIIRENKTENVYLDDDMLQNVSDNISVENTVLKNIDITTLRNIIMKLNSKEQIFIILSYYEGLNDRSISKEMKMPYNNIRMYRFRLLSKIRKMYERESAVNRNVQKQN